MKTESKDVLVKAFKALTEKQKANLRWHVKQGTTILCGRTAPHYVDGKGGGWPATLAGTREVPKDWTTIPDRLYNIFEKMQKATEEKFIHALMVVTQDDVREVIKGI